MITNKLLFTPGPLTTSAAVKSAMLRDAGSRDADFLAIVRSIRERLLTLSDVDYTMTYCILDAPLPVENYVATLKLYPITVGNKTLGTWSAEFKVTKGREEDVVDAVGNGTFGKAFEVMNELLGKGKR